MIVIPLVQQLAGTGWIPNLFLGFFFVVGRDDRGKMAKIHLTVAHIYWPPNWHGFWANLWANTSWCCNSWSTSMCRTWFKIDRKPHICLVKLARSMTSGVSKQIPCQNPCWFTRRWPNTSDKQRKRLWVSDHIDLDIVFFYNIYKQFSTIVNVRVL